MRHGLLALLALLTACASRSPAATSAGSGGGGAGGSGSAGAPIIGGDRPVTVQVPSGYQASVPAPLLVMLHGYSVDGTVEELYLQLSAFADQNGFLYAHPDGTIDKSGEYFWNATDACCNFNAREVDDAAFLDAMISQIGASYEVDPKRIDLIGHSNGGFMSYAMACKHADTVAAMTAASTAVATALTQIRTSEPSSIPRAITRPSARQTSFGRKPTTTSAK